jgi:hypothetical protein
MFGRYLAEAAEVTGEDRLEKVGGEFHHVGDAWEGVAASFRVAADADDPATMLEDVVAPMFGIADEEEHLWGELAALLD